MGWRRMQEQNRNARGPCSSPGKRSGDWQPSQDQTCLGNGNTCMRRCHHEDTCPSNGKAHPKVLRDAVIASALRCGHTVARQSCSSHCTGGVSPIGPGCELSG